MLKARTVLNDAKSAYSLLKNSNSENERRILWVASLTLARATMHTLEKVDTKKSEHIKAAVSAQWDRIKNQPQENKIFHEFIELERNAVLKQYELNPDLEDNFLELEGGGFLLLESGERLALESFFKLQEGAYKGQDGQRVLQCALDWVEAKVLEIESLGKE